MQSSQLSHYLAVELHDEIDQRIVRDEEKIEPLNDETLHELKQQRLKLKDELYRMATAV